MPSPPSDEHRFVMLAVIDAFGGVARTLGRAAHHLARRLASVDARVARLFAAARCRVGDEHRLPDQKRHVCESEMLKFGGVGETPMKFSRPPQLRFAVDGSYAPRIE